MLSFLWIPATMAATVFQVARNAMQRELLTSAGPWAATLVRFLFGLPFSILFAGLAWAAASGVALRFSPLFWLYATVGGAAQIAATAALLVAMGRSSFALGTALQQSSLPLSALIGLSVFGDQLSGRGWTGIAIASVGLAALSWPSRAARRGEGALTAALAGLGSGASFAISINCFRHAAVILEPVHPLVSALVCVVIIQAMQSVALTAGLAVLRPASLIVALSDWRRSIKAGVFGSAGSGLWFIALALAPSASVRAVGVVEMPVAALAGRRLFRERLTRLQWAAGALTALGVCLTALG